MPSSSSSRRVQMIASRLVTKIFRSSSERSMIGGMKPSSSERRPCTGSPCIGSAATILTRVAELLLEAPADAHQRAAGAEARDEGGDLVELLEDLGRRAVVVRGRVGGVAVLVGHEVARVGGGHLERHLDRAVGALRARRVDDLGAVHLQQLGALRRHVVGHDDLQRIALARADHRERDAGVAGGRLEDGLAGRDRAPLLGVLDQRARDAILDRAGRVVGLELGPDAHARLGRKTLQLDQRRVADGLDDVAVATAAGAVLELRRRHFRKYSLGRVIPCVAWGTPASRRRAFVVFTSRSAQDGRRRWRRAVARAVAAARRTPPSRSPGDEWKQFAGTTLNFISENTAPTSAIAANLEPFTELTGIDIKITQLELTALVQKVALDFASGHGAYQIVYADPYQILAPYHEALVDLNTMMDDHGPAEARRPRRLHPDPARRRRPLRRQGQALRAALRRPDDDLAVPQGPVREVRRPDEAGPRLRPHAQGLDSTWEEFYKTSKWFKNHADETDVPYGHGHQAKQHDSLMNDFSQRAVGLRRRLLQGRRTRSAGSARSDPGEPMLDSDEAIEAADVYRRLSRSPTPPASAGTGTASAPRSAPASWRWPSTGTSSRPATRTRDLKGKVGYARLPRGPKRSASMYGGTGIGINGTRPEREQKAAWLFVNWATSQADPARQPQEQGRRRHPHARLRLQAARGRAGPASRRRRCPTSSPTAAVFEAWKPENIGLRPKIAAWNECDTAIFTQLSKMLAGQQAPEKCMATPRRASSRHRERGSAGRPDGHRPAERSTGAPPRPPAARPPPRAAASRAFSLRGPHADAGADPARRAVDLPLPLHHPR